MPETAEKTAPAQNVTAESENKQGEQEEEEEEDEVEIIDGKAVKDRERMIPIRLLYLSKELKMEKPCVEEAKYWEAAATWIDQMLKKVKEGFQLTEMLKKSEEMNRTEIKKLFDDLRQKLREGGGGEDPGLEEAFGRLSKPDRFDMTEFWDKAHFGCKHDFTELFDWMQESFEFIAEKIEKKIEVTEAAVEEVNKLGEEFFKNIFDLSSSSSTYH